MPTIEFKVKVKTSTSGREYVTLPKVTQNHIDRGQFIAHPDYKQVINSDLFISKLCRNIKALGIPEMIYLDSLPSCIIIKVGFISILTLKV